MVWFFKKKKNKEEEAKQDEKPVLNEELNQDEMLEEEAQVIAETSDKEETLKSEEIESVETDADLEEALEEVIEEIEPVEEALEAPLSAQIESEAEDDILKSDPEEVLEETQTSEPKQEEVKDEVVEGNEDDDEVLETAAKFFDFTENEQEETDIDKPEEEKSGWFTRLREGLSKSSTKISDGITSVFTKSKLDDTLIEELEDILITSDLGPTTAAKLVNEIAKDRFGKDVTDEEIKELLAVEVEKILEPVEKRLTIFESKKPFVILMSGVNGAGKTTTIGKIGHLLKSQGKKVMMAAGDTFRAAAIEQLTVWGERSNIEVYAKEIGSDAAALAYEAYERAIELGMDVLIIDTAGRLQNKKNLMEELSKIVRVLKKHDEDAPHSRLIVLDATTGQNAHSQIEAFSEAIDITGMVMTKLDGSAKGGVIVSLADKYKMPIHAIGIGEKIEDLRPFKARSFARGLMGLEE
ncbi:MAG: signal recognition particle-docking protein FtsY [Rickettsiales bacterium]|nr:signal recognition particle-docking protein FtsY [Rickettsiales bacterium]